MNHGDIPQPFSSGPGAPPPAYGGPYYQPLGSPQWPVASGRRPRRARWYLVAGAIAAVIAVVAAGLLIFSRHKADGASSPGEAVRSYLAALARGDASAALALAKERPTDTTFLSDEILKRQIEHAPISDVQIVSPPDAVAVHVIAKFGDQTSDEMVIVMPPAKGQGWKVDHAAVGISFSSGNGSPNFLSPALFTSLRLFGKPVPAGDAKAYVFPGWREVTSTNPYVKVTATLGELTLLNGLTGLGQTNFFPKFAVSDAGKAAAKQAVNDALARCSQSHDLAPANCPQHLPDVGLQEGSVSWDGLQANGIDTNQWFDPRTGTLSFLGFAKTNGVTVKRTDGSTMTMPSMPVMVTGSADLTQQPPAIKFGLR